MQSLTLFRILTFILLPIAALFGFMDFFLLIGALANPPLLLMVFVFACFVIYTFASLRFLTKGIDAGRPQKSSLRDWIRVNAYVCCFIVLLFMMNVLAFFFTSDINLRQYFNEFLKTQPNVPPMMTLDMFLDIMRIFVYFTLFMSVVLFTHILMNFRLMKAYRHLFVNEPA